MSIVPLLFASSMVGVDVLAFSIIKQVSLKALNPWFAAISMAIYGLQPFILWKSLAFESLTVMNVLWNLMSSLIIGAVGIFFFEEKVGQRKLVAVVLSLIAVYLFTFEDGYSELENYITNLFK